MNLPKIHSGYRMPADAAEDLHGGGGDDVDSGDGGQGDGDGGEQFAWPDGWREQMAGDDEKALKQIGRYATPAEVWKKARALEQKISSGELKPNEPFPEKGSDDDKAAWLESRGLPKEATGYEIKRQMEDDEREALSGFLEFAHGKHMAPEHVNAMVDYFFDKRQSDDDKVAERDDEHRQLMEDDLRDEWGKDFRPYMNRAQTVIDQMPGELKEIIAEARLPDGTMLKNSADFQRFLVNQSLSLNPTGTQIGDDAEALDSIQDEIASIKQVMRDDRKRYNSDEKMQQRYRDLLAAADKMKGK